MSTGAVTPTTQVPRPGGGVDPPLTESKNGSN